MCLSVCFHVTDQLPLFYVVSIFIICLGHFHNQKNIENISIINLMNKNQWTEEVEVEEKHLSSVGWE